MTSDHFKKPYKILIFDYKTSEISAEIPFLFKKAGCAVDVFCMDGSWLLKNSFYDRHISAQGLSHTQYAESLKKLVRDGNYDWVVPADDTTLRIIHDYAANFEGLVSSVITSENKIMLGSKAGLHALCAKHNILTPNSHFSPGPLSFPIVLKIDRSSGGKGVFMCHNKTDAATCLAKLSAEQKQNLLFQEYVVGDNIAVEALFKSGRLLAYAYSVVLKNTNGEFSASFERKYLEYPAIEHDLQKIGEAFGLNGFCSMTFMRGNSDQKHYLIEADLRPQVWFPLARHAGVDFSRAISNYLHNRNEIIRPSIKNRNGMIIWFFPRTILHAIRNFDVAELAKWIFNSENRWRFLPTYDGKLFWLTSASIAKILLYRPSIALKNFFRFRR